MARTQNNKDEKRDIGKVEKMKEGETGNGVRERKPK